MFRTLLTWRSMLVLVISMGLLLSPLQVRAEDEEAARKPITLKHIKDLGTGETVNGEEKMTFTVEEYKKLIYLDLRLQQYESVFEPLQDHNRIMVAQVNLLRENNKSLAQVILDQQDRIEVLTDKWATADLKWRKEKYKPKWGNTLSWSITAGALFFAAGTFAASNSSYDFGDL